MTSSSGEALALLRSGRAAEAERLLRAAMAGGAADADAIHLLGFLLATSGRAPEGLPLIDRSIALAPRNPGFLDNRAQVLLQMGRVGEAVRDARAATALAPRFPEGWLHLAQALRRLGERAESAAVAQHALALDPGHVGAAYHVALLLFEAGDLAAAEAGFARVLERDPRHAAALNNLGVVQRETGREAAALDSFVRATAADPRRAPAQNNLGLALQRAGRNEEALEAYLRAGFPESLANAAGLALELERLEQARELYARAAAAKPGFADAEYGLAQVALREHRFAEGWDGYERRFDTRPPLADARSMALPRLDDAGLARARRVAVWQEQGLGDQVLFTTLLPELERRGIGAVVEVDARLLGIYRRSLPAFEFVARGGSAEAFAGCDFQIPMGSLARLFRRDAASFAAQPAALLRADPARVEEMRRALAQAGDRMVAVSWRSPQAGGRRALGERKSVPLEAFAARVGEGGTRLLDLQYGEVGAERDAFEARHPGVLLRVPGLDTRDDLEGVAAALVACGRFVTASNAAAHLAGALGVPTQLLLPRGWPPFSYWAPLPGGRSIWYPSVAVAAF
jgi:tetratricopeptide (TPR) repeat protein